MYNQTIAAFTKLGQFMAGQPVAGLSADYYTQLENLTQTVHIYNGWFTPANLSYALKALGNALNEADLTQWLNTYSGYYSPKPKTVGIVMAGNIPLAGFHDFMCVLLAGHKVLGKLSSDDAKLLPFLAEVLIQIEPELKERISFTNGMIKNADAYIATGSNNSARYFEYYFGKYPAIIRKNRNSVAVLTGNETADELANLANDIFLYFGLGCRSVNKLYVPAMYKFEKFFEGITQWEHLLEHNKYRNNYDYNKTLLMLNNTPFLDNGFVLLKHDRSLSSAVSVINYEYYSDIEKLTDELSTRQEELQCIATNAKLSIPTEALGQTQLPSISTYADGVDTLHFLLNL